MLSTGTINEDRTVTFLMKHERGLVIVEDINKNKWHYSFDTGKEYPLVPEFTGNIPYTQGNTAYFLIKPSTTMSVMGMSVRASAGAYVLSESLPLTGTPVYTFSTSSDGRTWGSYTSELPEGLNSVTSDNTGEGDIINFTVDASHEDIPKVPAAVSGVDLSMVNNDGTAREKRETANCYMIHAPGTYRLPLVYGNAISNGATNPSSYMTGMTGNILQHFVNHKDAAITDPWIKSNGITVDGAKLIWQDARGLIPSVGVDGDYLTFTVSPDHYRDGNALIAATSGGTVVWSWHIWVTDETFRESDLASVATGSHTYKVAPVNVGQFTVTDSSYCRVRVSSNNLSYIMELPKPLSVKSGPYNPYYQWGRKDAEMPCTGGYDIDGNALAYKYMQGVFSIGKSIQNPELHYYNSATAGPYNKQQYNYWDANQTGTGNITTATVKTVYDPCPPGFCVPTGNLYYYMGNNPGYAEWSDELKGRTWTKDGYSIFFPATGFRSYDKGTAISVDQGGFYWSASASDKSFGRYLNFYSTLWRWDFSGRAAGYSVRAVMEEKQTP